jgi:polysaccharide biosynthesis/export protein
MPFSCAAPAPQTYPVDRRKQFSRQAWLPLFVLCALSLCYGQTEEYVLQRGDVIGINVVEHPEFSVRYKIRPDGKINYPVIGEIDVASLTCAQLVKVMEGKLSAYVNSPVISVSIEEYYANKIYIMGAVHSPGVYQIYEPIDVLKAIAMCGGLNKSKEKNIRIIRADGTITRVDPKLLWGSEGKRDSKKYILFPGDAMYVPEGLEVPWGLIMTILTCIVLSLEIFIYTNSLTKH